ncbi:MAG: hypothetical protein MI919_24700, partial [Holophagales bacterium]|nr:hypothetical protein [Holophagales bacterium]
GHFHRWLVHEPYRRLAECPEGIEHPFSPVAEPFGLCPTDPRSMALLEDLYAQLLPCFRSRLFNLGLDETLDLGRCRSKVECETRGVGRVYLDFLHRACTLARRHGRRPMFWGDIISKSPELIAELPADAIALEWAYEPDHPFAEEAARFAAAGRDFYVCPGTGAWSSFAGRLPEALVNLEQAAYHGRRHGALGYLITDWGDHGHLQPPPIGWPGWLVGACNAWNAPEKEPARDAWEGGGRSLETLADRLAVHLLPAADGQLAGPLLELGRLHGATGARALNGSALFYALHHAHLPAAERRGEGMTIHHLNSVLATLEELGQGPLRGSSLLARELRWVADMLGFAARFARARLRAGPEVPVAELPDQARRDLLRRLESAAESLGPLWLARSRPGGLRASRQRLLALRPELTG